MKGRWKSITEILKNIMVDKEIRKREVIEEITVPEKCTWFVQAILEDTGLVSVSLGGREKLTIFYDSAVEKNIRVILSFILEFCTVEILG